MVQVIYALISTDATLNAVKAAQKPGSVFRPWHIPLKNGQL
jgi:hypothetical protein